jgi:hypothetical protein
MRKKLLKKYRGLAIKRFFFPKKQKFNEEKIKAFA